VGGNFCSEGDGVGDNGSNCGGDGDSNGCSAFGVNGGVCGVSNATMKSMKITTATSHQHENQHNNQQ
jgi:hypothetical protein